MKAGRPQKEINIKTFESLCQIQCTEEEICCVLDVDEKTLQKWCKATYKKDFSQVFRQKKKFGTSSLRRKGWKLAETNPAVWIFHAKNFLGMSDQSMPSNDEKPKDAIEINVNFAGVSESAKS